MLARITVDERNTVYSSIDGVLFNKAKTTLIKYPMGKRGNPYVIPTSVTYIGKNAFESCWNLTEITVPAKITIGEWAFNASGLTMVTIGAASIGDRAFMNCERLASVTLLPGVTSIGVRAFQHCKFTSITIPASVTRIRSSAFENCLFLSYANIGAASIGDYAFKDCKNLASVTLLPGVTSIGDSAFQSCKFTSITIPDSVTKIERSAFWGCPLSPPARSEIERRFGRIQN